MKTWLTILLLLLADVACAQTIMITGTVLDPLGKAYQNGQGVATLVPGNVQWLVNNYNPVPTPVVINELDSFGHFSIVLTNTSLIQPASLSPTWQFSFCSQKYDIQPLPVCFTMTPLALTSSQDISTQIQAQSAYLPIEVGYGIEVNGTLLTTGDTINFNNSTPAAPANGRNVVFATSNSSGTDSVSASLVGDGNASHFLNGIGTYTASGGGGNPVLENCTPDQTGNSFPTVVSLTNWFNAHWEFIYNTTTYINCEVYVSTAQTGATLVVDVFSADSTAGHTANIQTCDAVITTGSLNVGALSCASAQTFTTTSSAYHRVTLTFNVQSTLSDGCILAVKIGTAPTGTAPTSDILIYPHFVL